MSRRKKARRRFGAPPKSRRRSGDGSGGRRFLLLAAAAIIVVLVGVSMLVILPRADGPSGPPKAAIVDQLSLTYPNPGFADETTVLLEEAGYVVDYYPGEEVTVDFYRDLPTRGYDLLLLRVHAARRPDVLASKLPDEASLFTSEAYSRTDYVEEQDDLRLVKVKYSEDAEEVFFGVRSDFISSSMRGDFDGATVVLMGCDTLRGMATADAFVERGAAAVIGWSDLVSASHTDEATQRLLEHLVAQSHPVAQAVAETVEEVGPDPAFGSTLLLYPPEVVASSLR